MKAYRRKKVKRPIEVKKGNKDPSNFARGSKNLGAKFYFGMEVKEENKDPIRLCLVWKKNSFFSCLFGLRNFKNIFQIKLFFTNFRKVTFLP